MTFIITQGYGIYVVPVPPAPPVPPIGADKLRHSISDIIPAIRIQIGAATGLPLTAIKLIGRPATGVPQLTGDRDVLVRPSRFIEPCGTDGGGGRVDLKVIRQIFIFPRLRMQLDQSDRDDQWLISTGGILRLEEKLINGLVDFSPLDKHGNRMTTNGIKLATSEDPDKDLSLGPERMQGWGLSSLAFSVEYMPPIDQGKYGENPVG